MMIIIRVWAAEHEQFAADAFESSIGRPINVTGVRPTTGSLTDYRVTASGQACDLTIEIPDDALMEQFLPGNLY